MRRFVSIVLVIGLLLFGSSLFEQQVYAQNSEDIVEAKHHLNVTDVSEDEYLNNISGIKELTGQELLKLVGSKDDYILFLGYKECPYCREFSKSVKSFKYESVLPFYYVDVTRRFSDVTKTEVEKINTFLQSEVKLSATPTIAKVVKGRVAMTYVGAQTSLDQLRELNGK